MRKRMFGRAWPLRAPVRPGNVPTWPQLIESNRVPCTVSTFVSLYFGASLLYKIMSILFAL